MISNGTWTDGENAYVKRRWTEGATATQIAHELRTKTKNAVLGKVHRLKMPRRPQDANQLRSAENRKYVAGKIAASTATNTSNPAIIGTNREANRP